MKPKVKKVYPKNRNANKNDDGEKIVKSIEGKAGVDITFTDVLSKMDFETEHLCNKSKMNCLSISNTSKSDISIYLVGDLVWTKVRKTKAWPAMVTYDPDTGNFFQERTTKGKTHVSKFHVQYFGDQSLRGWVSKGLLLKFQDENQDLPKEFSSKAKFSSNDMENSWIHAVNQASQASLLTLNARKLKYLYNYDDIEKSCLQKEKGSIKGKPVNKILKSDKILKEIQNPIALNTDICPDEMIKNTVIDDAADEQYTTSKKSKKKFNTKEKSKDQSKVESKKFIQEVIAKSKKIKEQNKMENYKFAEEGFKRSKKRKNESISSKKQKSTITEEELDKCVTKINIKENSLDNENISMKPSISKLKLDTKESLCFICEEISDDLIDCSGECLNSFHADCLGLKSPPVESFKCDECLFNYHTCFACKQPGSLIRCSHNSCGKFYHLKCIENIPQTKIDIKSTGKFQCPLHNCHYCSTPKNGNSGKILKCLRCPTAYHQKSCLLAGSTVLNSQNMICDKHFIPDTTKAHHNRVNVTWCFVCSIGGSLVCCDTCPASFHPECISEENALPLDEGIWQCRECKNHQKPKYGDIVWVKFSCYRWWPAKICFPLDIPEKIRNLSHSIGEFPVYFFGSKDYIWLPSYRCFKYQKGDKGVCGGQSKSLASYFLKALGEAKETFIEKEREEALQAEIVNKKKSNKPPSYKQIKGNRPVTCIRNVLDSSEWPICSCGINNTCTSESDCLNQILYFECNSKTCPAKENCKNQRMQKCDYVKCQPFKCEGRGWGLKSLQDIRTGDFVIEYVGELIDEETCYKRISKYHENDVYDYYFLTIDRDNIIDAYPKGNLSRFMNHSCDPNCITQKWTVNGEVRVGLFAIRDIKCDEELCFNYNLDCLGNEKKQCKCGANNCSGFLGVRPKTQHAVSLADKVKLKELKKAKRLLKKEKKSMGKIVHEDECFICTDGGELLLCGKSKCSKSYHVKCLNLEKLPRGRWDCPRHFCDMCGKTSCEFCTICPNSFCKLHLNGQLKIFKGLAFCEDHDENEIQERFSNGL